MQESLSRTETSFSDHFSLRTTRLKKTLGQPLTELLTTLQSPPNLRDTHRAPDPLTGPPISPTEPQSPHNPSKKPHFHPFLRFSPSPAPRPHTKKRGKPPKPRPLSVNSRTEPKEPERWSEEEAETAEEDRKIPKETGNFRRNAAIDEN